MRASGAILCLLFSRDFSEPFRSKIVKKTSALDVQLAVIIVWKKKSHVGNAGHHIGWASLLLFLLVRPSCRNVTLLYNHFNGGSSSPHVVLLWKSQTWHCYRSQVTRHETTLEIIMQNSALLVNQIMPGEVVGTYLNGTQSRASWQFGMWLPQSFIASSRTI